MKNWLQSKWAPPILGAILFIATMFFAAMQAVEEVTASVHLPSADIPETESSPASSTPLIPPGPSWTYINPEMEVLLEELRSKKDKMDARRQELVELESRVQSEKAEMHQTLDELNRMQQEFEDFMIQIRTDEIRNLMRLAKVFSSMEPEEAIVILREMQDPELVKIMAYMKEHVAAAVLARLAQESQAGAVRAAGLTASLRKAIANRKIPQELQVEDPKLTALEADKYRTMALMYSRMPVTNAVSILQEMETAEVAKILLLMQKAESSALLSAFSEIGPAGAQRASELSGLISRAYDDPSTQQALEQARLVVSPVKAEQLKRLAKVYSAMPPTSALGILEAMDDEEFARILYFISEEQKAEILSLMSRDGGDGTRRATNLSNLLGSINVESNPTAPRQ